MNEERVIELTLGYDEDTEDPHSFDGAWKLYTGRDFEQRMTDKGYWYRDRTYRWLPDTLELFWKLRNGLAFTLDGWVNAGRDSTKLWVNTPYDPTDKAVGLYVWEESTDHIGAKTYQERADDAQGCLDAYNMWAQGDCYWYATSGYPGDFGDGDSCGGFIGWEYFAEVVKEALESAQGRIGPFVVVAHDDETEAIFSHRMLPEGIEYHTRKEQREIEAEYEKLARTEAGDLADTERLEMAA